MPVAGMMSYRGRVQENRLRKKKKSAPRRKGEREDEKLIDNALLDLTRSNLNISADHLRTLTT